MIGIGKYYRRAERAAEIGDKYKSAEEWNLAVRWYKEALDNFDKDPKDLSYYKAEVCMKMAFCYELLIDIPNRNECYELAAQNYEHIDYIEWAKRCKELCMRGAKREVETEDEVKDYVEKIEDFSKRFVPQLVDHTRIDEDIIEKLKAYLLITLLKNIEHDDVHACGTITTAINHYFENELSKNKKLSEQLAHIMIGIRDLPKNKEEIKKLTYSFCLELVPESILKEVEKNIDMKGV